MAGTELIKIRPLQKSPVKTNGGYYELWVAVIKQAVDDYRNEPDMRSEVAKFLKSDYFEEMTDVSGQVILDKLKNEIKVSKGFSQKS